MTPEGDHDPTKPAGHPTPPGDAALVPVDRPISHDAQVQEMKAGAAPLVRIIPIAAQTQPRNRPGHAAIATVPFLTVAAVRWSKVTVGDTIGRLVHLLQERGGIWLAKHTTGHPHVDRQQPGTGWGRRPRHIHAPLGTPGRHVRRRVVGTLLTRRVRAAPRGEPLVCRRVAVGGHPAR